MPNQKKHALRYLLLRHLWSARRLVPVHVYEEICDSLTVDECEQGYIVKWMTDGREIERQYKKNEFQFFIRGDNIEQGRIHNTDPGHNTKLSQEFVIEALSLKDFQKETNSEESLFPRLVLNLCYYAICGALIWFVAGKNLAMGAVGLLIFLLFSFEFWYQKGKLLIPPLLAIFIVLGFPFTLIITSFVYSMFQLLDPSKKMFLFRVGFPVGLLAFSLFQVAYSGIVPFFDMWVPLIAGIAIAAFLLRWTCGSHFRCFPLVFPFFCIGMYLDGQISVCLVGLSWAIIGVFFAHIGFYIFPLQKEKVPLPNI